MKCGSEKKKENRNKFNQINETIPAVVKHTMEVVCGRCSEE
jgi:hypothetical protein